MYGSLKLIHKCHDIDDEVEEAQNDSLAILCFTSYLTYLCVVHLIFMPLDTEQFVSFNL